MLLWRRTAFISIASFCVTRAFATNTMRAEIFLVRHGETTANRDGVLQGQCDFPLTEKGEKEAAQVGAALADVSFTKLYASDLRRVQHTTEIMMSVSKTHKIEACIPNALLRYVPSSTLLNPIFSFIFSSFLHIPFVSRELSNGVLTTLLNPIFCSMFSSFHPIPSVSRELSFGVREMLPRATPYDEAVRIYALKENIPVEQVVDPAETLEQIIERQRKFLTEVVHPALKSMPASSNTEIPRILCVCHGGFIKRFLKHYCKVEGLEGISNCSISKVQVEWAVSDAKKFKCSTSPSDINITTHIRESVVADDGSN